MSATPNMPDDPPTGPPKVNPLSAQHYAAAQKVLTNCEHLEDAIQRAYHIGLEVGAQAAQLQRDKAVVQRILAMYPQPAKHPLELET